MSVEASKVLSCIQCGECTGICPESGRTPFNVRRLIRKKLLHFSVEDGLPWYCTSCGACTIKCPRRVKPSEAIIELRSAFVEDGRVPATVQKALENTMMQRNPWGRSRSKRAAWAEKSDMQIPHVAETKEKRLLFSCCILAYDPRCMVIPVNVARIFRKAGLEFGILGGEEACCGNEIRRMGETGLFEDLVEENKTGFEEYGVREIITLSPHCMNTLKKEYDLNVKVRHYTEVVAELIGEGRLTFGGSYEKKVIYHDPCFLGRQNGILDEPRSILHAVQGLQLMEFRQSRKDSLCCEGGGGRMFVEVECTTQRNSETRVIEAAERQADVIATACPFCVMTLEDPATDKGQVVREVSEILAEVL